MKKRLLFYLLLSCLCLFATSGFSQGWLSVGNSGSDLIYINEVTEFNGDMFAAGRKWNGISGDGAVYSPMVFKLTGNTWTEFGSGFVSSAIDAGASLRVEAIVEFNSELYVGGNFSMNNGTDPQFLYVAKWDNTNSRWVPVGDGTGYKSGSTSSVIKELTVFNGNLYAGGDFDDLGLAGTNNIAIWDGTSWAPVGTGISTGASINYSEPDQVTSMVVFNGELIVGGKFSTAGDILVHNIAKWDGTKWAYLVGLPIEGGGGVGDGFNGNVAIRVMQEFKGDLYIGGMFSTYYNVSYIGSTTSIPNHLVVWDGSFFSAPSPFIATPTNNRVSAMTVYSNRIYIGNETESNIYSWDGSLSDWILESAGNDSWLKPSCFYSNASDIYFGWYGGVKKYYNPKPAFTASATTVCAGAEVTFTDASTASNTVTGWSWTFAGGTPATSTAQNPVVTFAAGGPYNVTLAVTSADGTNSITAADYITVADAMIINSDPSTVSVCSSENASFSVTATGTGTLTYQWQINDGTGFVNVVDVTSEISGATTATLTYTTPSSALDASNLRCVVTNGCGSGATSGEALLNITDSPVISETTTAQAVCVSGDASFTVSATGSGTLTYQWQYYVIGNTYVNLSDAGVYSGTNTATLSITGADNTLSELWDTNIGDDGKVSAAYRCIVTTNGCSVNTGLTYLNIHTIPSITTQPVDVTACNTGSAVNTSFSVVSSITPGGLTYQWKVDDGTGFVNVTDGGVYSGATTNTLSLTGATSALSGNIYKCVIGNCATPVESTGATLTIDDLPTITVQPVGASVCAGENATFSVEATGTNLSYQWYVDGVLISDNATYSGATTSTLTITSASTNLDSKWYRCILNSGGSGTCSRNSASVKLRVYGTPTLTSSTNVTALTVCDGGTTSLTVQPGTGYVSSFHQLQWQYDFAGTGIFTDIADDATYSGSTTKILTITNATMDLDGSQYRCVIKNCIGEIVSTPETLVVNQLPLMVNSPQSQTVCVNEALMFIAGATGTGVTYQWYVSSDGGTNYSVAYNYNGYSTDTLTISSAGIEMNGLMFKCVASAANPCTVTSESFEATLTVNETTITAHPVAVTICDGENASFSITGQGDALTYQWYNDGNIINEDAMYSGTNTATLTITGATKTLNGAGYNCIVTGVCSEITSGMAYLYVNGVDKPVISADFNNAVQPRLYVSNVFGESYEWFLDGNSYSTNSELYLSEVGSYTVMVYSNGCASEMSDAQVIIITQIEDTLLDGIQAYPNPVQDKLVVRLGQFHEDTEIRVVALDGKIKIRQIASNIENVIDMRSLPLGVYLLQVSHVEKTLTYKIFKNK